MSVESTRARIAAWAVEQREEIAAALHGLDLIEANLDAIGDHDALGVVAIFNIMGPPTIPGVGIDNIGDIMATINGQRALKARPGGTP